MFTEIFYISLTGIGVVFSFLFIIFLLLKGLKLFADDNSEQSCQDSSMRAGKSVVKSADESNPEMVAAVIAALKRSKSLEGKEIVITKK